VSGTIAGAALLVAAVTALGAAALRVASVASPGGLERVVAAAPLFVAAAVAEALALGSVGLGGSGLALAGAAVLTWVAVARWTPRPAVPVSGDFARGAVAAGLLAGWVVWALRFPYLGLDGSTYHLSAVAEWVRQGTTGHSLDLYVRVPVGSYPLTWETSVAWAVGLAHSFAPVALWSAATVGLLVGAGWLGLRALDVPRAVAALAILALCLVPVALRGLVHAETDMPAVAWLVTAAALTACAQRRPNLLPIAVVAAALAVGTKTTTLPLAAIVVALGLWQARASLRGLAVPLACAAALGFVAGGLWYFRNLLAHGSPAWPFVSTSWGDPVPPLFDRVNYSLLDRPRATLEGQWPTYRVALSGGLVLVAGGLLAPLWARRREVLAAAAVTLLATLAWASAPFTGAGAAPFLQVNTLRYAIPAMAAGVLALALSARTGRRTRWWVTVVLLGAIGWSVKAYLDDTYLPAEGILIAAALAGAAGAAVLKIVRWPPLIAGVAAVGLFAVMALGGRHYVERHALAHDFDSAVVKWFTENPTWRSGAAPVSFSPTAIALLSGDRLRHPLSVVPADEPCPSVRMRVKRGWVVVRGADRNLFGPLAAETCLAGVRPVFTDGIHRVYGPGP
jgi:hypothetical protein